MARIALNLNPVNPVALREMRARMRGPRAFILLGLYLGLLALLLYVVYLRSGGGSTYTYGGFSGSANFGPTKSFEIGQNLFITVFLFLVVFVSLITPAITGGMVSRELEGRTYELLVITPVRSRAVVFGKLFAALGFIFFMVASALPMACIVFIFGGVTLENILIGFGVVLMAAVTYGAIGLFFSGLVKRTGLAVMLTYSVVAIMLVGSVLVSNSITTSLNNDLSRLPSGAGRPDPRLDPSFDLPKRILAVNPVAAIGSILARNAPYRPTTSDDLQMFPNSRIYGGNPTTYYSNSSSNAVANNAARLPVLSGNYPLWVGYMLIYAALGLLFFLLSLLVVKPGLRARIPGLPVSFPKSRTNSGEKKVKSKHLGRGKGKGKDAVETAVPAAPEIDSVSIAALLKTMPEPPAVAEPELAVSEPVSPAPAEPEIAPRKPMAQG